MVKQRGRSVRGKQRRRSAKRRALGRRLMVIISVVAAFGLYCVVTMMHNTSPEADSNSADIAAAEECGRKLALQALATPPGTMAHEEALLYMRNIETRLRAAGYGTAANAFAAAADEVFMQSK